MTKLELAVRIVLLALGWVLVVARAVTAGLDAGTLWSGGGLLAITLALALVRFVSAPPPTRKPADPEMLSRGERLAASTPGKVVTVLSVAVLAVGTGSIAGVLVFLPILGPTEMIAALPDALRQAALGATLSVVGFVVLGIATAVLGTPILSGVLEEWPGHIAPAIGGVASVILKYGTVLEGPVGDIRRSGTLASGILAVGLSAVVGGIAYPFHRGTQGREKLTVKNLGEATIAGLGFGAINGLVLALILGVLGMLR